MNWKIDGELMEKVERQIAPIFTARREIPPIIVRHKIEWIATNNDNFSHVFEVLQDGIYVALPPKRILEDLPPEHILKK